MRKSILIVAALLLSVLAAAQTLTRVDLAKDNGRGKPGDVVKGFSTSDNPIHCVLHLKPLDAPVVFTGTLIAVNADRYRNYTVATTNISGILGTTSIDFKFSVGKAWPAGTYRIALKASSGRPLKDLTFEIK